MPASSTLTDSKYQVEETLRLNAPIADAYAEGQRELLDPREPGDAHRPGHLLAADESVDRFREVLVGPRLVPADECGRARQDLAEVEVIQAPQDGIGGEGEFENDYAPAGAQDAVKLGHRRRRVGDVANAEGDGDDVAAGVGKRQRLGVAVDPTHLGRKRQRIWRPALRRLECLCFPSCDRKHLEREINANDSRPWISIFGERIPDLGEEQSQIASATSHINDDFAPFNI